MSREELIACGYIAAMIDGEGSVYYNRKKALRFAAIYNTEETVIEKAAYYLDILKIEYTIYTHNKAKFTHGFMQKIHISKQNNLKRLYELIGPILCERKGEGLRIIANSYVNRDLSIPITQTTLF